MTINELKMFEYCFKGNIEKKLFKKATEWLDDQAMIYKDFSFGEEYFYIKIEFDLERDKERFDKFLKEYAKEILYDF